MTGGTSRSFEFRSPTPRRVRNGLKLQGGDVETPRNWVAGRWIELLEQLIPTATRVVGLEYARSGQIITLQLSSGPILIFDYYTRGIGNGRFEGQVWRSEDQWKTVSGPEKFLVDLPQARQSLGDDRGDTIPTGILWHRTILELPNGDLLAGIYGVFEEDKEPSQYRASMQKFRALLLRSRDVGKNWSYVSTIASGPMGQEGYNEPVIVRLSQGRNKGRLICLMRTGRQNPIYQAESDDEGASWRQAQPMRWMYSEYGEWKDIVGVDPDLIEMSNGILVCSFGHKPDFKDNGIFVAFSLDQGHSWTQVTRQAMDITGACGLLYKSVWKHKT